jgi:hypothetical protein
VRRAHRREKEECLRDERKRQERKPPPDSSTGGSCDALVGPDKERCCARAAPRGRCNARTAARQAREAGRKPVRAYSEGCSGSPGAGS